MIFGADKIPEIARGMGKGIRQVRDATQEIKSEIKKGSKTRELRLIKSRRILVKSRKNLMTLLIQSKGPLIFINQI